MNWTKVGLKGVRSPVASLCHPGLNWTKVGLKVDLLYSVGAIAGTGLNWTKVGLKESEAHVCLDWQHV